MSMNVLIDIIHNFDASNATSRVKEFEMCRVAIKIAFGPILGFAIDRYRLALEKTHPQRRDAKLLLFPYLIDLVVLVIVLIRPWLISAFFSILCFCKHPQFKQFCWNHQQCSVLAVYDYLFDRNRKLQHGFCRWRSSLLSQRCARDHIRLFTGEIEVYLH